MAKYVISDTNKNIVPIVRTPSAQMNTSFGFILITMTYFPRHLLYLTHNSQFAYMNYELVCRAFLSSSSSSTFTSLSLSIKV